MLKYRKLAWKALAAMLEIDETVMQDSVLDAGSDYVSYALGKPRSSYHEAIRKSPEFWRWWLQVINNRSDEIISKIVVRDGDCWFNDRLITDPSDWIRHMLRPSFIRYYPNTTVINMVMLKSRTA